MVVSGDVLQPSVVVFCDALQPSVVVYHDALQSSVVVYHDALQPSEVVSYDVLQPSVLVFCDALQPSEVVSHDALQDVGEGSRAAPRETAPPAWELQPRARNVRGRYFECCAVAADFKICACMHACMHVVVRSGLLSCQWKSTHDSILFQPVAAGG